MITKPIKLIGSYLFTTLIIYIIMYNGQYKNIPLTVVIVSIYFFCLIVGYIPNWKFDGVNKTYEYNVKIRLLLLFSAIITLVISVVNILTFYPSVSLIVSYMKNPGSAYEYVKYIRRNSIVATGFSIPSLLGILLNTFTFTKYIVVVFLPLYWKDLRLKERFLSITSIIIYIIQAFLFGAMINIASLVIVLFPVLIFYSSSFASWSRSRVRRDKVIAFMVCFFAALAVLYFLGSRGVFKYRSDTSTSIIMSGLLGLLFYVAHGYVGLSYCLQLPFVFTWGQTSFRGLSETILPYLGLNTLWNQSYLMRSQQAFGWSALQVWSTAFPWLASDFSFLLIPIIMFFIGYFMRKVWSRSINNNNPFAFLMMGQLMLFSFMIPANNQLFHTFGNTMGTIIIFLMYRWSVKPHPQRQLHYRENRK